MSQRLIMDAVDASKLGRKWFAAELGTDEPTMAHWRADRRPMPMDSALRIIEVLRDERPEMAADVMRDLARRFGMVVEPMARPEPAATSRRAHANLAREYADLTAARADADEDGQREAHELARRLREIREMRKALAEYETVTAQELAAAEQDAGVMALGLRAVAK